MDEIMAFSEVNTQNTIIPIIDDISWIKDLYGMLWK
jgi:hypothetical protein